VPFLEGTKNSLEGRRSLFLKNSLEKQNGLYFATPVLPGTIAYEASDQDCNTYVDQEHIPTADPLLGAAKEEDGELVEPGDHCTQSEVVLHYTEDRVDGRMLKCGNRLGVSRIMDDIIFVVIIRL